MPVVSLYLCDNWKYAHYISSTSVWGGFPWWEPWLMGGIGIFFTKSWHPIFLQAELASWPVLARTRGNLGLLRKVFLSDKRGKGVFPPSLPLNSLGEALIRVPIGTISRSGSTKWENKPACWEYRVGSEVPGSWMTLLSFQMNAGTANCWAFYEVK